MELFFTHFLILVFVIFLFDLIFLIESVYVISLMKNIL